MSLERGVGRGWTKNSGYEWKHRFQTHGFAGLKDLSIVHHSHPPTTPPEVVDRIFSMRQDHPDWGDNRILDLLALYGIRVSHVTGSNRFTENGMGARYDRPLKLEKSVCRSPSSDQPNRSS